MLTGILRFEWRAHTRRLTFALATGFFGLLGFVTAATGFGPETVHLNGPYAIANAIGLLSLGTVFSLTLFCAQSVLRDDEHQMAEIVYSTAVTKANLLAGRLGGSLLASVASFAAAPVGMVLGARLVAHEPTRLGPFHLLDYLWPFAVLALPSLLFAGSLLFAVAALARSSLATYVAGVALYVLYLVGALASNSPLMAGSSPTADGLALAALFDPFGISAFFEQTQYWTPAERNVRRLALEGSFLGNRLLVILGSGLVLGIAYRFFKLEVRTGGPRRRPRLSILSNQPAPTAGADAGAGAEVPARGAGSIPASSSVHRDASVRGLSTVWVRALASRTGLELRQALGGWPFLSLLVLFLGGIGIELWQSFRTNEFGTALLPTSGLVIGDLRDSLMPFGLLVIVYWSAELVWRDRAVRVHEIVDATPAPNGLFLVSKLLALSALVLALTVVASLQGVVLQTLLGPTRVEAGLYASLVFFAGLPLALVAVLAVFLQTLAPNRYAGMLATVLAIVFWHRGSLGGPQHPLLRYAAAPEVAYSDLNGFGPLWVSFAWFMLYGSLVAGVLALIAGAVWQRGTDVRLLPRLRALPRRLGTPGRAALLAVVVTLAAVGGHLFHQTSVVNAYETRDQTLDFRADYERAYRRLEAEPQPSLASQSLDVALFPEEGRCRARGRYRLENRTPDALRSVWVAARRDLRGVALTVAGRPPSVADTRFGMYSFSLDPPLSPGASTELTFDVSLERRGATADGDALDEIVANGSFLMGRRFLPTLGYRRTYELREPDERRRRGLPESTRPESPEDEIAHEAVEKVPVETTISTSLDQIAVAPGPLASTWVEGGRRHFRYASGQPMPPHFACASGRYEVARRRVSGVDVSVLHHAGHATNLERILDAAARTLAYGIRHFGPYPFPELRIVEVPAYWRDFGGLAMPGVVFLVEHRAFLTDARDEARVDLVTKRVAHEVAHQWWGLELSPPAGPGATVLVESLARYSELMILKEKHGPAALVPVLSVELGRYLSGRAAGREVPLHRTTDQGYLSYSKGALVLTALEDLIGEENVNRALAEVFRKGSAKGGTASSLDLLASLRAVTPPARHALLDEWLTEIVIHDLRVTSATTTPLPDGRFRVTARLEAGKTILRDGREVPLTLDEELSVAVFATHPGATPRRVLHEGKLRVRGPAELSVVVDERPAYVSIDPYLRRIDRNRADNLRRIE